MAPSNPPTPTTSPAPKTGDEESPHATFDAIARALHEVASALDILIPRQTEAANAIRLGRMDDAFPILTECIGHWQRVEGSLVAASHAAGQPVERVVELVLGGAENAGDRSLARLTTMLHTLKATVQGRDWVGLADTLEYDLNGLAERWRAALYSPEESAPSPPDRGRSSSASLPAT